MSPAVIEPVRVETGHADQIVSSSRRRVRRRWADTTTTSTTPSSTTTAAGSRPQALTGRSGSSRSRASRRTGPSRRSAGQSRSPRPPARATLNPCLPPLADTTARSTASRGRTRRSAQFSPRARSTARCSSGRRTRAARAGARSRSTCYTPPVVRLACRGRLQGCELTPAALNRSQRHLVGTTRARSDSCLRQLGRQGLRPHLQQYASHLSPARVTQAHHSTPQTTAPGTRRSSPRTR